MGQTLLESVETGAPTLGTRLRALYHGALVQLLGASKWQLLFLGVLTLMGVVGFVVSPYHSKTRLAFLLFGLVTCVAIMGLVNSPRRFWQAFGLLTVFGLLITLVGAAGTAWSLSKLAALESLTAHFPQAPSALLASIGAPDGIHPNQVAGMLTLYLPPLFGFLLFRTRADALIHLSRRWLVLIWITLSVMLIYLALSFSRGGLLAIGLAIIFLLWTRQRAWGLGAILALVLFGVGAYFLLPHGALSALITNTLSTFNGTGETRTEIWRQAIQAIAHAPLTGIGLYNFRAIFRYTVYLPPDSPYLVLHAHNTFLQAALDVGLPGAIAYTLLLINIAWHAYRTGQRSQGAVAGVCYGLAGGILAFGIYGLFDTIPLTSRVAWLTWFSIGVAASANPSVFLRPAQKDRG